MRRIKNILTIGKQDALLFCFISMIVMSQNISILSWKGWLAIIGIAGVYHVGNSNGKKGRKV